MYGGKFSRFGSLVDPLGTPFTEDFFVYQVPQQNQANQIVTIAPGASIQLPVNIMADSHFEWLYTTGSVWNNAAKTGAPLANPNILVQVSDSTNSRALFSAPIPWSACVGTAQQPFILPVPRRFMSKTTLTVTLTNFDPAITFAYSNLSFCGRKVFTLRGPAQGQPYTRFREWEANGRRLSEDLYAAVVSFAPIAAGATGVASVILEGDSDFEWMMTTGYATNTAGNVAQPFGSFVSTINFADGGSQRALQNQDVYAADVIGTSAFPFLLTVPRMFLAKTPIVLRLQNFDSAIGLANVTVAMFGRKIFEAH